MHYISAAELHVWQPGDWHKPPRNIIIKFMKHTGSFCEYNDERNRDLMRVFRSVIISSSNIRLHDIFRIVVNSPSQRFWVSEKRAAVVVGDIVRGRDPLSAMTSNKREMYIEILSRVLRLMRSSPDMALGDAVAKVVSSPAPKFYLTPDSARIIYYRCRSEWHMRLRSHAMHHARLAAFWRTKQQL